MDEIINALIALYHIVPTEIWKNITIIGKVSMYLQGVNIVSKKDIDLATDYQTVQKMISHFSNKKQFCSDKEGDNLLPFSYLLVDVEGVEVEFFDVVNYGKSNYFGCFKPENITSVNVRGINFNVLNLNTELQIRQKLGKVDDVVIINKFLNQE